MKNFIRSTGHKIRKLLSSGKKSYSKLVSRKTGENQRIGEGAGTSTVLGVEVDNSQGKRSGATTRTATDAARSAGTEGKYRKPKYRKPASKPAWSLEDFQVVPEEGKSRFHDYDIPKKLMRSIAEQEFRYCTPIQSKSLETVLQGVDLVGKANTGTGKTAVFLIAILSRLLNRKRAGNGMARSLILAPTRELVMQIAKDARKLSKYCHLTIRVAYGGVDYQKQQEALLHKKCDVLIATPGRLLDFLNKGVVNLDKCSILVLDEADRMLDMGFIPDVRRIVGRLPSGKERQTMLFSATVPDDVKRLSAQWCVKPTFVEAEPEQVAVETVEQVVYLATAEEKYTVLYNLIQNNPDDRIIVFTNMKNEAKRLADKLQRNGIECVLLSGDVAQNKRVKRLDSFRAGKVKILVATDVAGRGIHIEGITLVVNYNLPYEPEDYVHRIGRTGRAGASGKAVSFACEEGSFYLPQIEDYVDQKFSCILPEEELLVTPPAPSKKVSTPPKKKSGKYRRKKRPSRRTSGNHGHRSTKGSPQDRPAK